MGFCFFWIINSRRELKQVAAGIRAIVRMDYSPYKAFSAFGLLLHCTEKGLMVAIRKKLISRLLVGL